MQFTGRGEAALYAKTESRKKTGTFYVILSRTGGVHYEVETNLENKREEDRVLDKYEKGVIVK